jgi:signal transduction histidine kinase/CheY-like chemotaxis protein
MVGSDLLSATILIVDDEEANVDLLIGCLEEGGYSNLVATRDPESVASLFDAHRPDLVLLDLHMPRLDGFGVLEGLGERLAEDEFLPVLVLTADVSRATKERALSRGAKDFLTKPFDIGEVLLRIRNLLHTRHLHVNQRQARRQAEAAERRASLLAEASEVLTSSFDYNTTLSVLCSTIVPRFADYCIADVLKPDGKLERAGLSHVDPAKEPLLLETAHSQLGTLPPEHPIAVALTQGRRTLAQEITPEMISAVVANEEHRKILEQLRPRSLITVPIMASRRIHGVLVFVHAESDRRFCTEDLELACELSRRAAMTIENAHLFDQAVQATRARDEMLGIVAHDLRNPLSTITMGSSLLIESATSDATRRHAQLVHRAAGRMQDLIQDLLEVRRIEGGKLRVSPMPELVPPLLKEAIAMLRPLAEARQIELLGSCDEAIRPALVDASRILQVLSNLVGNALKFTPAGGAVHLGCTEDGEELRFSVVDSGPGIPLHQIPHVFGRFWQASDGDSRGIGLGLSIVQGIVEAHGGRVWVESELGHGARFYFTVPVAPAGTGTISLDPNAVSAFGFAGAAQAQNGVDS